LVLEVEAIALESADPVRARLQKLLRKFEPTSAPPVSGPQDFRRAADQGGHESIFSMNRNARQLIFEPSAAPGGAMSLPPHVQVPATAASHPILAEANEKNVSERDPAGRTAGRHGGWAEAL
jgi:hypothetical protein